MAARRFDFISVVIIFGTFVAPSVFGIRCFVCNFCSSPIDIWSTSQNITIKECKGGCVTSTAHLNGQDHVNRDCNTYGSNSTICEINPIPGIPQTEDCFCQADLCNYGNRVSSTLMVIIILVVASFACPLMCQSFLW